MKLKLIIIALCLASASWGCLYSHDVTPDTLSNFPILTFIHEKNGIVDFRIYIKDTGNLKGLERVQMGVEDQSTNFVFSASISIYEHRDLSVANFSISKEHISQSRMGFSANETKFFHSCSFVYGVPLNLIYEQFKMNEFTPGCSLTDQQKTLLDDLRKKKFQVNRKDPQPKK